MSTMTIVPSTGSIRDALGGGDRVTRAPGAPVRWTRRGRMVLVAAFLAAIAVLMVVLGNLATGTRDSGAPEPVRTIEIGPGDTLYAIAGTVAAPGHLLDMVARIERLNALSGPELQVGQRLAVPLD